MIRTFDDKCKIMLYDTAYNGDQLRSPYRLRPFDWGRVCNLARNPLIASTLVGYRDDPMDTKKWRDCIPLWAFCNPVDTPVSIYGKASDIKAFHALQIDYDSGAYTIDTFIAGWSKYTFALYTTPSYDGITDMYRVIIPLAIPKSPKIFDNNHTQQWMVDHVFPSCDASTMAAFRKQRVPAKRFHNSPYRSHISHGEIYELPVDQLLPVHTNYHAHAASRVLPMRACDYPLFDCPIELIGQSLDGALNYAKHKLDGVDFALKGAGIVNQTMLEVNRFLAGVGVSEWDRKELLYSYTSDPDRRSSINRMVKWSG